MDEKPVFLQGTYHFKGEGLDVPIDIYGVEYLVPEGKRAKVVYFRAGQSSDELISLILLRNEAIMRLFPLGMKSSMHFPLAIQEELPAATKVQVKLAAPKGADGTVFIDFGLIELG